MFLLSYFALWLFMELPPLSTTVVLLPVLIMDHFPCLFPGSREEFTRADSPLLEEETRRPVGTVLE